MHMYLRAVRELRDNGFVSDDTRRALSAADLARAVAEAGAAL